MLVIYAAICITTASLVMCFHTYLQYESVNEPIPSMVLVYFEIYLAIMLFMLLYIWGCDEILW